MTYIVSPTRYPTKKSFKEAINNKNAHVYCADPSIFAPYSGYARDIVDKKGSFTVTNHPKRSWFACVKKNAKGELIVT